MKYLLLIIIAINPINDIKRIAKVNALKETASKAYNKGDYAAAKNSYELLIDSLGVDEPGLRLNLANSYFHLSDTENAVIQYQQLSKSDNALIKSTALQQLGVINNRDGKFKEALELFKQSIKANPKNDEARFNYEMLKKKLKEQEDQENQEKDNQNQENNPDQKDKNKDKEKNDKNQQEKDKQEQDEQEQDKQDQQQKDKNKEGQENKDKEEQQDQDSEEQKEKEMPPSTSDKLKQMNISEDKARMLLEAMKNQEIQYLQQNKRKATQKKDPAKPDW
jgi:Ca-activated chloride channel homolog